MSLNKLSALLITLSLTFVSCGDKEENLQPVDLNSPEFLKNRAAAVLETQPSFADKGDFIQDSLFQIAAGVEVENESEWGIKFSLVIREDEEFKKYFETGLLEGSFKESQVNKIKFPSYGYELVYYSSKNYFMGSGGGDVFSYIIDFKNREVYSAHLASGAEGVKLYISQNTVDTAMRNFFAGNFKRDYPSLVLVDQDIDSGF